MASFRCFIPLLSKVCEAMEPWKNFIVAEPTRPQSEKLLNAISNIYSDVFFKRLKTSNFYYHIIIIGNLKFKIMLKICKLLS